LCSVKVHDIFKLQILYENYVLEVKKLAFQSDNVDEDVSDETSD